MRGLWAWGSVMAGVKVGQPCAATFSDFLLVMRPLDIDTSFASIRRTLSPRAIRGSASSVDSTVGMDRD